MNALNKTKSLRFALLLLAIGLLATTGCKKDENPAGAGGGGRPSLPQTPTNFGGVAPQNVLVAVRGSYSMSTGIPGLPNVEIDLGQAVAKFNQGSPTAVSVVAGGQTYNLTKDGNTFYYIPSATNIQPGATSIGIEYGSSAQFNVQGYNLTTNTVAVPSRISISNFGSGATLNRNSNFTVAWTGGSGGNFWQVFIVDSRGNSVTQEGTSGSSVTFAPSQLSRLATGTGQVIALRYNYVFSNNQETVLVGEAISTVSVNIQ